jgi:hypothetical protein
MESDMMLCPIIPRRFGIAFATVLALISGCTDLQLAGSISETTNGGVVGAVVDQEGAPAEGTRVVLLPADYDPVKHTAVVSADTTDSLGKYAFSNIPPGHYAIQAVSVDKRTSVLIREIFIGDLPDTVAADTLRSPGAVKVMLPSGADAVNGYVYVPGTLCFTWLKNSSGSVILDSVPAGKAADIAYSAINAPGIVILRYGVSIKSNETASVWNPGWGHCRAFSLNTSATGAGVTGSVTNFPVLIRLTAANFDFTQARNNGEDIMFAKRDNTFLPYEIERWDPMEKRAEIWVKVDTVFGNDSTQTITMYWDNPNASGNSNGPAVFDTSNGFQGVWHLNRKCDDVTYGGNNGTNYGTTDTTGIIGYCKKFNGSDSIKIAGLLGSPANITLSAWAQLDTVPGGGYGGEVLSIGDAVLIRMDFSVLGHGTMGTLHPYGDSVYYNVSSGQFLKQTGWHLIAFTIDQNNHSQTLYIDGSAVRAGDSVISIDYSRVGQNTFIGTHGNGSAEYNFSGRIDEVRVYRKSISADYIKLSFMNQKEQDALVKW